MMQRESFLVPVYYIIFPERAKRYDFTHIYEFSQATFSMAKPSLKPSWQSLYYPLTNDVWAAVLTVLLLIPAIVYMISTRGKARDAGGRTSLGPSVLEVMGIVVGQNLPLRLLNSSSSRLLVAVWLVFSFVIGTAYRSNLIAALTLPKYPPRPETVEQMVDTVDSVTMPQFGEDWLTFFAASDSEVYKKLAKLMVIGPGAKEGLQMATEQNTAPIHVRRYMANMIAEHFTQVDGTTPLYLAQESIFPGPSGWPIPHDAPYKPQLDRCLISIIEGGLYEKWSEDVLRQIRRKSQERQQEYLAQQQQQQEEEVDKKNQSGGSIMALTLTHMQGPLMLLLIIFAVAGITFIGEILVLKYKIPI
ncbi:ionotropic receptor 93a-like [Panulirus ornatus]|uniref:ionotropic receptor 93a-like n=1 Tax=Panulirus ornatus TaxID=150431 RepID=UPI003A89B88A